MKLLLSLLILFFSALIVSASYEPTPPSPGSAANGILYKLNERSNIYVFHLWGNESQRGESHGELLATQIIDFLDFFLIRSYLNNNIDAYNNFTSFLQSNYLYTNDFHNEINGILTGMRKSGKNLTVPSLNRDINLYDLHAINAYIEIGAQQKGPFLQYEAAACTQILAQNTFTYDRSFWAGRNMDGEIDKWKVTVTHLIIFAIERTAITPRIVSIMWPGFIGTLSGINEYGIYSMLNMGSMGPSNVIKNLYPASLQIREFLNNFKETTNLTPEKVNSFFLENFASNDSSTGTGVSGPGVIIMIGWNNPYYDENKNNTIFALEQDRLNSIIRLPNESIDFPINDSIIASNHFRKLGVNFTQSQYDIYNLDVRTEYFESAWRYTAGSNKMLSYNRTIGSIDQNKIIDFLQSVSHGETEHSIIVWMTGSTQIWLAVADFNDSQWDAPYETWHHFVFEDLFTKQTIV